MRCRVEGPFLEERGGRETLEIGLRVQGLGFRVHGVIQKFLQLRDESMGFARIKGVPFEELAGPSTGSHWG